MSVSIIHHVREKSQSKGSARTLLLNLAIYANDCCGVAWPADATLYHDVNVSRQRIHELKNALEQTGELVIVERPGTTNLYFVAWQGQPLGGSSQDDGQHAPGCPLRNPRLAASCPGLGAKPDHGHGPSVQEGSEIPDTPVDNSPTVDRGGSECPDPQGSKISDGGGQKSLTQKSGDIIHEITGASPATRIADLEPALRADTVPKAEARSRFWCEACGVSISTCVHRVIYGPPSGSPGRRT
jgi:hypothetical protein